MHTGRECHVPEELAVSPEWGSEVHIYHPFRCGQGKCNDPGEGKRHGTETDKDEKFLLAASQGNEEQLKELKENGYNPSLLMVERLHINVNSNEGKEAVSKVFGIDIEKGKQLKWASRWPNQLK